MPGPSLIVGALRGLVIAAATAGAAFGLLVVFHPFSATPPMQVSVAADTSNADAVQARIEALRGSLRDTETAVATLKTQSLTVSPAPAGNGLTAQYEAQIAAATERRDLALRHATAIRDGLRAGLPVSSLAEIRDSVMVGQLLSQQSALDVEIAEQGARLKPTHPVMRALLAQRGALLTQIDAAAASIATALESEAKLDDAQIELLQSQLPASGPAQPDTTAGASDTAALETQAAAQRAELDALVDAYFNIKPATATASTAAPASNPLNLLNLIVVGVAGFAALLFQAMLAGRRRRARRIEAEELAAWRADHDVETVAEPVIVKPAAPSLRRAS